MCRLYLSVLVATTQGQSWVGLLLAHLQDCIFLAALLIAFQKLLHLRV